MQCTYCGSLEKGALISSIVYPEWYTVEDRRQVVSLIASDLGNILYPAVRMLQEDMEVTTISPEVVDALWYEDAYEFYASGWGHRAAIIKHSDELELIVERVDL